MKLKFQTVAEKTAKHLLRYFAAPGISWIKGTDKEEIGTRWEGVEIMRAGEKKGGNEDASLNPIAKS